MDKHAAEKQIDPRFKIGMRNIKTAVAVGVCLLFFQFIGIGDGIQAAIAAIICMKSSLQNSLQTGIERVTGTFIGVFLGVLTLLLIDSITYRALTLLAIIGVVLIIYLCNIFKAQGSTIIGLVVFLIILIGEKDLPPVLYGAVRLAETIFGIFTAYVVNRFFDPRHIRKLLRPTVHPPEIRAAKPQELGKIMSIWLKCNLSSHPFIDESHWHEVYDSIRSRYRDDAKIYVYEKNDTLSGFISILNGGAIDGIYVIEKEQDPEIEDQLLHYCQELFPCLTATVYADNEKYAEILLRSDFIIINEFTEEDTGAEKYTMTWS